jgi:hypothetical protein
LPVEAWPSRFVRAAAGDASGNSTRVWENELFVFGVGGLLWIILVVLLVLLVVGLLRGRA